MKFSWILTYAMRDLFHITWNNINIDMSMLNLFECENSHTLRVIAYLRFSFGLARFPSIILFGNSLLIDVCDLLSMKHIVYLIVRIILRSQHVNAFHLILNCIVSFLLSFPVSLTILRIAIFLFSNHNFTFTTVFHPHYFCFCSGLPGFFFFASLVLLFDI